MVGEVINTDPELRKARGLNTKAKEARVLLDRLSMFSDWKRAVKAIACPKRHAKHIKGLKHETSNATSVENIKEAELFAITLVQTEAFSSVIKSLRQYEEVKPKDKASQQHKPSPWFGAFRVGGHLTRNSLQPHVKYPSTDGS